MCHSIALGNHGINVWSWTVWPGTKLIQMWSWWPSLQLNKGPRQCLKIWTAKKKKKKDGGLGEENRHLSPFEWFRHPPNEGGRLGQLILHAQFQALKSNSSVRTLLETQEEAAVWVEFPLEGKAGQPSRWDQTKRGWERKQESKARTVAPTARPFLSPCHKLEPIENGV